MTKPTTVPDAVAAAPRTMRADARRNYQRLLDVAKTAFMERGTEASLEDIARRAGVGIGTLYRHFPTRHALIEAVLDDGFTALGTLGAELLDAPAPREAMRTWLRSLMTYSIRFRGLAAELMVSIQDPASALYQVCQEMKDAGAALLVRAQEAKAIRPDVTSIDLFRLAHGVALAAEKGPTDPAQSDRLLDIVMAGLEYRGSGG